MRWRTICPIANFASRRSVLVTVSSTSQRSSSMLAAMRRDVRVQFVHGLESSPQGIKAQLLARHFDARTPAMDTHDFEASVAVQAAALREFDPHVLVGS